jgi:hypothetical protein
MDAALLSDEGAPHYRSLHCIHLELHPLADVRGSVPRTQVVLTNPTAVARIRCGSTSSYTDPDGNVWDGDRAFTGGTTYTSPNTVPSTTRSPLYQNERYGTFSYSIAVPANGDYVVNLHFAEIFWRETRRRIFNVNVQGQQVVTDLDIWARAPGAIPLVIQVPATVTNRVLSIQFVATVNNAKISGIEVLTQGGLQPAPICYRLTVAATRGTGMAGCPRCVQIADLELNAGATPIALTRAFQTTGE